MLFVILALAAGIFIVGYLLGWDAADAETSAQVEALERTQRIHAATFDTVNRLFQTNETTK